MIPPSPPQLVLVLVLVLDFEDEDEDENETPHPAEPLFLHVRPHRRRSHPAMKRILLPLATLFVSALASAAAPPKPNIVFIMADDLGWADVAFHGGSAPTPNLDKLAAGSLELTHHYVAPVCSPTRTGLMTGRFWSRYGVTTPQSERALPWETVTLPKALKEAGYDTCLTGKWHLGSLPEWGPNHYGFDHSYGSLAGGVGPYDHRYKKGEFSVTWHRNEKLIEEEGHVTDLITNEAVQWIEQRADKPFFLYVPFTAVHLPVKEPQAWLDKVPAAIQGEVARHYAACVMHLDDSVGRILAALEKNGKRRDTLVVFTSDNGGSTAENNDTKYPDSSYPQGALPGNNLPLRGKKGDLYEGGIRVPTVLSWPAAIKPGKIDTPLHITDWMPTFCTLAGWQAPEGENLKWDGRDILPVLTGRIQPGPRPLYWTARNMNARAVRLGEWKLIVTGQNPKYTIELFNLDKDPHEKKDLASSHPEKVKELQALLTQIARNDHDSVVK